MCVSRILLRNLSTSAPGDGEVQLSGAGVSSSQWAGGNRDCSNSLFGKRLEFSFLVVRNRHLVLRLVNYIILYYNTIKFQKKSLTNTYIGRKKGDQKDHSIYGAQADAADVNVRTANTHRKRRRFSIFP